MKKYKILLAGFLTIFFISCNTSDQKSNAYITEHQTDNNGFHYETITNDPTGLRVYTLDNGLKVYLSKNNDEPKIQTYIAVRAGSSYDPKESTGLAHYLEHMLFKGTNNFGTSNWELEEPLIAQISDLYELHRAEKDPEKKEAIYRKIDSVSYVASKFAIANELNKIGIPASAVQKPQERIDHDESTKDFGLWPSVDHTEMGDVRVDGQPVHFSKTP